jgi:hypothetical protein
METRYSIQILVLCCGILAGVFMSRKVVIKLAVVFVTVAVIGLIISSIFHSESLIWIFGIFAMAVGFVAISALISGFIASSFKQK